MKPNLCEFFPLHIQPMFLYPFQSEEIEKHIHEMEKLLQAMIPFDVLHGEKKDLISWIQNAFPYLKWSDCTSTPDCLSVYIFCKPAQDIKIEDFFLETLKRWLVPEKELPILQFRYLYFHLPEINQESYFAAEAKILLEDSRDLTITKRNLPLVCKEIAGGIVSSKYAKFVLETKSIPYDRKQVLIHQDLIKLTKKRPDDFDLEVFKELNRFMALTGKEFREQRLFRHITRIACSLYLLRKNLRRAVSVFPEKRHLNVRFFQTQLSFPFGKKSILSLSIGLNVFHKHEYFEESHIEGAIKRYIPNARVLKNTFYLHDKDSLRTIYVELEKSDGTKFPLQDVRLLKRVLAEELKIRIENLIPQVFMVRNEEEIMKDILLLSQELKYVSDIPQVLVSFQEQSSTELTFIVILVRLIQEDGSAQTIESIIRQFDPSVQIQFDRIQHVGLLRKKYPKEANVFRIKIEKDNSLLRSDTSVNLYLARQMVSTILSKALGEIRDVNGGIILKQGESFSQFKQACLKESHENLDFIESFFFSINPIEKQATLPFPVLKAFYGLFEESLKHDLSKKENYFFKRHIDNNRVFIILRVCEYSIRGHIEEGFKEFQISSKGLITAKSEAQGHLTLGYLYDCEDLDQQVIFLEAVKRGIKKWLDRLSEMQVIRLKGFLDPVSLDPRVGGDEQSGTLHRMLFEGLMRIGKTSKPTLAISESYQISDDKKKYTFKLRESFWSDGTTLLAEDFEYAWKKILSPDFKTPFAYLFYPILNAKAAKEAQVPLDQVGVKVVDNRTLEIQLENPTPYFLELVAQTIYSPVHHNLDRKHPNWPTQDGLAYVCNGPFMLKKNNSHGYEMIKNNLYWDNKAVKLDQISIIRTDRVSAKTMFNQKELDWVGWPFDSWISYNPEQFSSKPEVLPVSQTLWYGFNTKKFPLNNTKIRQALGYAIDYNEFQNKGGLNVRPHGFPVPQEHTFLNSEEFPVSDVDKARELFREGLNELKLKPEDFPVLTITLTFRHQVIDFIREQWKKNLNIDSRIEVFEWPTMFARSLTGEFQILQTHWRNWINDPVYTLNCFKDQHDRMNFSHWENAEYVKLLDLAEKETDLSKRNEHLKKAEIILFENRPYIAPFTMSLFVLKNKRLKGIHVSNVGVMDFKWASVLNKKSVDLTCF